MSEASEKRAALDANAAFYAAFAGGLYDEMDRLWARTTPVLCSHPGAPPIHGRDGVMESWRAILAAPPAIQASGARASVIRGVAFVTCFEHIGEAVLAATNVLVWEDGAFRLVSHQAGAVQTEQEPTGPLH